MGTEYLAVALTIGLTVALSVPVGWYMARVFSGGWTPLDGVLVPIERGILRLSRVDRCEMQTWQRYTVALLTSNAAMFALGLAILLAQGWLPLNPDGIANMEPWLAFNTIASFTTNTNLQHYSGETGLSYLSQMTVVTFLQFVTAATGMAACVAVIRCLGGSRLSTVGNFYVDVTRASVRVLLPLSIALAIVLMSQGAPMTFEPAAVATTVEGTTQTIARGVAAAEIAIKQLGTNGGGYFGPNSAHPFENPTPLTNLLETITIGLIPMAMVWTLGIMLKRRRFAIVLFASMLVVYLPMVAVGVAAERAGSPAVAAAGINNDAGSMEGKEVRNGTALSALWAVTTTVTSNGSVNAMHDSLTPIGGLMPFVGMWLNNIFGGVGVGFINMLIVVVITTFISGMMIGRTPELLGTKVEAAEMKLASIALVWHPFAILIPTAIACYVWATTPEAASVLGWLKNSGAHGFSEMAYEFSSAAANNGSGFEGLGDNTPFWNISTGVVMLLSRYIPIVAPLALAAGLARKPTSPETLGSLPVDSATFGMALVGVTIVLGLLMFMPVAVLGPIAEHLAGR